MNRTWALAIGLCALTAAGAVLAASPSNGPAKPLRALPENTATLTIKDIMDSRVDPAGDYLFESVVQTSDAKGIHQKQPHTAKQWAEVRHQLQVLIDAPDLLTAPGRKAANPEDRSRNAAVENQPEQIQRLMDSQHADFVVRAGRLRESAKIGMTAARIAETRREDLIRIRVGAPWRARCDQKLTG